MASYVNESVDKVKKTNETKAKTNRQNRILFIVLSLVLVQFSACSPGPSSPLTKVANEPPDFPLIRLNENVCPSERLYKYLIWASKGKIGPHPDIQTDYVITRLDLNSEIEISFHKASYRVYCEVSDNHNRVVIQSFASRLVEGRFEPGTDYHHPSTRKYEDFIARDAANRLMNDIYKKMPTIVAVRSRQMKFQPMKY
jgi:hypothetical protein